MEKNNSKDCPCYSGKPYNQCCEPFHKGVKLPETAVQLMRSRYSGYALQLIDYIMATTHPENSNYKEDKGEWKKNVVDFARRTDYYNLDILDSSTQGDTAYVTFRAGLKQGKQDISFTEESQFKKVNGQWLYHQAVSIRKS